MKRISRALISSCLLLVLTAAAGCTRDNAQQSATGSFEKVRDRFFAQQAYEFHGKTSLLAGNTANGNLVNFSGHKQGNQTAMTVSLSVPEKNQVDTLSLLSKNQRLYAKFSEKESWQSVEGNTAFQQEFANWDPAYSFEQMDSMRTKVIPLADQNQEDGRKAFRVLLDSTKLKSWLADQMRAQSMGGGSRIQSTRTHAPNLKAAMLLSESQWYRRPEGARIQASEQKNKINEIIDRMEVEAEYTVYYDEKRMLPTNVIMNIRSEYDMLNQRVFEHSKVDTYLLNYGRKDTRQP